MMSSSYTTGIVTQLLSPLFMTIGFILWESHWIGSAYALNLYKCSLGSMLFAIVVVATTSFSKLLNNTTNVGYLMLSSTLGIVIGDLMWLEALRRLGARRVIVVDTIKPFVAAILGQLLLNEQLRPLSWLGMMITVIGVFIVTIEKERLAVDDTNKKATTSASPTENIQQVIQNSHDSTNVNHPSNSAIFMSSSSSNATEDPSSKDYDEEATTNHSSNCFIGYLFALSNALFDTFGSFLTKKYGIGMTTWEINLVRFAFAAVSMIILSIGLWLFHHRNYIKAPPNSSQQTKEAQIDIYDYNNESSNAMNNNEISSVDQLAIAENEASLRTKEQERHQQVSLNDEPSSSLSPWYCLPNNMHRKKWLLISVGVVLVTFICPALSTYGLFLIPLGLALTLGSTGPIYALPLAFWIQKKKPTVVGCAGALLAFAGIVLLSVSGQDAQT